MQTFNIFIKFYRIFIINLLINNTEFDFGEGEHYIGLENPKLILWFYI
jgi:hypothetical protein